MALKNAGAEAMLRGLFSETRYLALLLAGDVEVSGSGYARKSVTLNSFNYVNNTATVAADITFSTPTGQWGDVQKIAIYDQASGGNNLWDFDLTNDPDAITQSGTTVVIRDGAGTLTIPLS